MSKRFLTLALLAGLAWTGPVTAQQFVAVPGSYLVTDITPDGSVIVGGGNGGGFYWRWQVDPAPTYIGGNDATAVSDDGTVIVGCITDPVLMREVAARWTAATGWVSLGYLPNALSCPSRSNAYDVSGDGSVVVGLSWDGCNGRGFRWTQATGMQELQPLPNLRNRASAISGDGSAIGGFAQGNFNRTPAYWAADTTGFTLDLDFQGEVNGFNEDGSLSVGTMFFPSSATGLYSAFVRTSGGTLTELGAGALNPGVMAGNAQDISEDADTVVGFDILSLSREAWVWRSADGYVSVKDRLTNLGVAGVPDVFTCTAVSDDGNVIVGSANTGGFSGGGYVATLEDSPWVNIGGGTVGFNGIPQLAGTGTLVGGTPAGMALTDARDSTLSVAWVAFAPVPQPFSGGTVHAFPYNSQFLFNTSLSGSVILNTTWPVGIPMGTQAWFQFLIADSFAPSGIVLSNALKATTP